MVQDLHTEVSRIMERFVHMVTERRRGGAAFELKQSAYHCLYCCELGSILPME